MIQAGIAEDRVGSVKTAVAELSPPGNARLSFEIFRLQAIDKIAMVNQHMYRIVTLFLYILVISLVYIPKSCFKKAGLFASKTEAAQPIEKYK
ncbi:MAG TPA: hypothetical protein VF610_10950 [Segetibacter sp.]